MAEEEKEIWKEIDGWSDYKVSTFGRVMSFRKYRDGKLLILCPDKYSYYRVTLCNKNKHKTCKIHRLVALTFLPNYYGLPTVDHIDQNKENNSIYNLRWASHKTQSMNKSVTRTDILETDPKERSKICRKQSQQRAIDSKKFYCNTCNKAFISNHNLQKHYTSKKHLTTKSNESTN